MSPEKKKAGNRTVGRQENQAETRSFQGWEGEGEKPEELRPTGALGKICSQPCSSSRETDPGKGYGKTKQKAKKRKSGRRGGQEAKRIY